MFNNSAFCASSLILSLAIALPTIGEAASRYRPVMTGERLIRDFMGPPDQGHVMPSGNAYVDRETARGYMEGIRDATYGIAWCVRGEVPHELNDDIVADISKLKPQDKKGNAALLVVRVLRSRFPCESKRSAP